MFIDFANIDNRTAYRWMGSTIVPRPVAWVSTLSKDGHSNLAPFSFFQMITSSPPTLMFCPLLQNDGTLKDSARNIEATEEFVVNLVPFSHVNPMNETSYTLPPDESEFDAANIESLPSNLVKPRRVAGVPVAFECRLASFMPYPADKPSCSIILGQVVAAHIDEAVLDEAGYVDPIKLDLVARMGGDWYSRINSPDSFKLKRPDGWQK
ncbi:MAG: flavin reductase [Rhizobacter sp.]|nr:flavin reductase [Rhizobacter sp.]